MSVGSEQVGAEVFDDDYLHFYARVLSDERSDAESALIQRLLEPEPGARVLDVPCGHGRIANRLAAAGLRVTGIDANERFLRLAWEDAARRGVDARFMLGDMRQAPPGGPYDVALNWYTSFGYFDDRGNQAVLRALHAALRPGGRLLLEMVNRDGVVRGLGPDDNTVRMIEVGDDLMVDRITFDPGEGRGHTERYIVRDGRLRRVRFSLRLPAVSEARAWLSGVGFVDIDAFDQDGTPFTTSARRLILRARRQEEG